MTSDLAAQADPASSASCWQCQANPGGVLFCPGCGALQPFPDGTDYFTVLGLPRSPALDRPGLDQRYYELSRQLHPDRYQMKPAPAQAASASNTALLNRAYRTLRDPVERGRYWLQLQGTGAAARQTTVPANLAALVFDVQEQLAGLRRIDAAGRPALAAQVTAIRTRIQQAEADAIVQLDNNLTQWQAVENPAALSTGLSRVLADIAYIRALLRDIDQALDA